MVKIEVSDTLIVQVEPGQDPHVTIGRDEGGLVRVEPAELRSLVAGLVKAAGLLAEAAIRGQT